ncbi:hypothetical protein EVAR_34289_1 [Eumeta japonica]|uniref:Uncharacterized protein n=1 Tax=Eumeta variegata TaxID=151549 RepID=A0A4C1VX50_EUMVA|nr:hypothetical protein EVAR_34289_1 [Eumeta japonica]
METAISGLSARCAIAPVEQVYFLLQSVWTITWLYLIDFLYITAPIHPPEVIRLQVITATHAKSEQAASV